MIKKVLLLTNYNLYETKRNFTEKFAEAMERKGIETKIIDAYEKKIEAPQIAEIKKYNPDFSCSFNYFTPMENTHGYFWDLIQIPHLTMLVDPSIYHVQLTSSPYSVVSCVDQFDCAGLRSMGFNKVFFLPHGVDRDLKAEEGTKRPFDVVFLASCTDYESLRKNWRENLPKEQSKVLDDAIEIVLGDNCTSLYESLVKAWNTSKLSLGEVDFPLLYYYLDHYTRGKDRVDLVRSIKDAKVHIFGELQKYQPFEQHGWEYYLKGMKNVVIRDSYPFEQGLQILKQSKIFLNSNPFFKNGSHERIFNGLACGAVPVTMDNLYVREHFKDGKDMIFYLNPRLDELNDRVNDLLANEDKRLQMAASGREKVMKHHTWDVRVDDLLKNFPR